MANLKLSQVSSGARLLKALAKKADWDGDGKLSGYDIGRATAAGQPRQPKRVGGTAATTPAAPVPKKPNKPAPSGGTIDDVTRKALTAAVERAQAHSQFSVSDVQKQIEDAKKQLLALDADRSKTVSDAELKKLKPNGKALVQALAAFAQKHGNDKVADFDFARKEAGTTWKPARPFSVQASASPGEVAIALVKHFDAFSNDNRWPGGVSRWVLAPDETRGIIGELEKMPRARARAVLKELAGLVHQAAVPLPYFTPPAVKLMDAFAAKVGGSYDFVGPASAPKFPGY